LIHGSATTDANANPLINYGNINFVGMHVTESYESSFIDNNPQISQYYSYKIIAPLRREEVVQNVDFTKTYGKFVQF